MTPADFRKARKALGLSQSAMAEALRLSPKNGDRTIRVWENGETVPGPAQVAVELLLEQKRTGKQAAKPTANPMKKRGVKLNVG